MATRIITEPEAWAHPDLGFTEPEAVPDNGYWRVFKPSGFETGPAGTLTKRALAHERATVLAQLQGVRDVYVSQNYFTQRRCTRDHVQCIPGAWVDLDIYRIPGLAERPRPAQIRQLLAHCDEHELTRPSYTIDSGRGLYLKWTFTAAAADTRRCEALNKALARIFRDFGADMSATDAARILRPVGSVNGKSGTPVYVAHREDNADGEPIRHDMNGLEATAEALAPREPPATAARTGTRPTGGTRPSSSNPDLTVVPPEDAPKESGRGWQSWNRRVLADITRLADLRWPNGPIREGWRDLLAFHAAVQIAHTTGASQVMPVLRSWAAPRLPASFVSEQLDGYMQSVCERAQREQDGETVEYQRQAGGPVTEVSPIYTYKRTNLLERLAVTPAESERLDVLVHDEERRARDRDRKRTERRARGCRSRDERGAARAADADQVAIRIEALRARGLGWRTIADEIGISQDAARKRLARLRKRRADTRDVWAAGKAA
jgi:hypothetical protein